MCYRKKKKEHALTTIHDKNTVKVIVVSECCVKDLVVLDNISCSFFLTYKFSLLSQVKLVKLLLQRRADPRVKSFKLERPIG